MNSPQSIIPEYYPNLYANLPNSPMNQSISPFSTHASDASSSNRNTPMTPSNDTDIKQELPVSSELHGDNAFQGMLQMNFQFPNIPQNFNHPLMSPPYFNQPYTYYPQFPIQTMVQGQENSSPSAYSSSDIKPMRSRTRTTFTSSQLKKLEATYAENQLPSKKMLEKLSEETKLKFIIVRTWFKNKRAAQRALKQL
ncbi:unnamed protein product [Caenorhabditis brenneri]